MSAKLPSHPATLPPASVTAKEEKMVTSSECRRVNHASVTTGRDRIVHLLLWTRGRTSAGLERAGITDQIPRVIVILAPTTDR